SHYTRSLGLDEGIAQLKIDWNPKSKKAYQRSPHELVASLSNEFPHVEEEAIRTLVADIDSKGKWSPYQALQGIKNHLRERYPSPPQKVDLSGTNITPEEAKHYFVSTFKTFIEAIVDDKESFKTENTPDDNHAEDNLMETLDRYIIDKGWDQDFTENHTLVIRINNSPCKRCARRIYDWSNRDIFDSVTILFANVYGSEAESIESYAILRDGGVGFSLMSVTESLLPLLVMESRLKAQLIEARKPKDAINAAKWHNVQQSAGSGSPQ
ncbi:MAG: hypothetical protein RIF46_08735, partial [Cyclobacteriaceae bacterium]